MRLLGVRLIRITRLGFVVADGVWQRLCTLVCNVYRLLHTCVRVTQMDCLCLGGAQQCRLQRRQMWKRNRRKKLAVRSSRSTTKHARSSSLRCHSYVHPPSYPRLLQPIPASRSSFCTPDQEELDWSNNSPPLHETHAKRYLHPIRIPTPLTELCHRFKQAAPSDRNAPLLCCIAAVCTQTARNGECRSSRRPRWMWSAWESCSWWTASRWVVETSPFRTSRTRMRQQQQQQQLTTDPTPTHIRTQLIEADRQRQANREALSALRKSQRAAGDAASTTATSSSSTSSTSQPQQQQQQQQQQQRKVWLLPSAASASTPTTFVKHTVPGAIQRLEAGASSFDSLMSWWCVSCRFCVFASRPHMSPPHHSCTTTWPITALFPIHPPPSDQKRLDRRLDDLRSQQKRLTAQLADRGAGPEGAGEGLLNAMLNLRDS